MNNSLKDQSSINYGDEINLYDLLRVIWKKKFYIGAITSLFVLISILYALSLPNIYKSSAILIPVDADSGMGGMLQQYSGMASLAGISLPSKSASKSNEAMARIKSFEFFYNHLLPLINLEDLLAIEEWNMVSNTPIYDESVFNSESGKWVRKVKPPTPITPSPQEAYQEYRRIMSISEDKSTSFVTLYIKHQSPFLAQQWIEFILDLIDQVMRDDARQEATRAVDYLNSLAPTVNYEEIKTSLLSLQQEQMKQMMMVEASENYIFKVLDSPLVPEIKSEPKRSLIVILGLILGMVTSILFFAVLHFNRNSLAK